MGTSDLIVHLRQLLGDANVLTLSLDMAPYLTDWRRRYQGHAQAVVRPQSTEQVAAIVKACADTRTPIVPQGGNTGLVGGATADNTGRAIVVSLTRMNRIVDVDPINNTLTAQSGAVLAQVQDAARRADRLFPLSLASEGSCTLGGNLSTNAGGTAVLRYGNTRDLCLAIEAVTPDGEVIGSRDGVLHGLRKDNTGYDLRDLFIGAEGTLGIITTAVMKLYPLPVCQVTAMAAVASPSDALAFLNLAQQACGATLTAFELISDFSLALVEKHFPGHRSPFVERPSYFVLIEVSDHEDETHAASRFEKLMSRALEQSLIGDAVIAQSLAQSRELWSLRELISEAQAAEGKNIKHDISVPISRIAEFILTTDAKLKGAYPCLRMVTFGHLGDGNLHYNVSPGQGEQEAAFLAKQSLINRIVHDSVAAYGGSISAEHGLGQLKRDEIRRYKPASDLALMQLLKHAIDPQGIMNPGKVI